MTSTFITTKEPIKDQESTETGKFQRCKFTQEEDKHLTQLVLAHGDRDWKSLAGKLKTKTARQCRDRWRNYLNPDLSQQPWSIENDQLLKEKYSEYGPQWHAIAVFFPDRSLNNIRNRYRKLERQMNRENRLILLDSESSKSSPPPDTQNHNIFENFEPIFHFTEDDFEHLLSGSVIP